MGVRLKTGDHTPHSDGMFTVVELVELPDFPAFYPPTPWRLRNRGCCVAATSLALS